MNWVLAGFAIWFVLLTMIRRLFDRRIKHYDIELHALEREALDSTVKWAYLCGRMGVFGDDVDIAVHEFRHRWGDKRREVTR